VGQDSLRGILLGVEVHIIVLIADETVHNGNVRGVLLVTSLHHLLELLLLDLKYRDRLLKEKLKVDDVLLVVSKG
jgi:hypothetical protein